MKFQVLLLLLSITLCVGSSQTSVYDCVLHIQSSSALVSSNCELYNCGGFIKGCCGPYFGDYLYALGVRANQTGKVFLNPSEQKNCMASMEAFDTKFTCSGMEKLTSGTGGCSDYTITDVVNQLGDSLRSLEEECMPLSTYGRPNETCTKCLKAWEDISAKPDTTRGSELANISSYLCRFAVLVSLTSTRIYDKESILEVYKCLGEHALSGGLASANEEVQARGNANINSGLWIAFGIIGVTVLVFLGALALFVTRMRSVTSVQHESDSPSLKITLKDVYVATDNLSASNFIGQGIAGKVYKGVLSNNQSVAVKHITNECYMETFVREVRSLSHVRHQNLVALLGYCENEAECFLVYELCHNGNLSEWLFGNGKVLSWIQRLEIAIDSARGLEFLHTYPNGCIVHRDIKARDVVRVGDISEFADPKLKGKYSVEAFDIVLKLALSCIGLKRQRPSIEYKGLENVKEEHGQILL
ncbi:Leucine-rich repeat receptor [Vigna angularis]|uniref:Leucine-rich repeat receptor n=1 Tax=Phaseolus angularis TaxID=3914 RepID=A0A8T0LBH5_PHAAN|nr:Leucine-rich repeat receptor [Vigna angularis]